MTWWRSWEFGGGGSSGGGGGGTTVVTDPTLIGDGSSSSNALGVASPFSPADKTKLGGIQIGAQVNVQADWNATTEATGAILNKPSPNNYVPTGGTDGQLLGKKNSRVEWVDAPSSGATFSINDLNAETPVAADAIPFADASDSGNPKKATFTQVATFVKGTLTSSLLPALGSDGQFLSIVSGAASWVAAPSGGGTAFSIASLNTESPAASDILPFGDASDSNRPKKNTIAKVSEIVRQNLKITAATEKAAVELTDEILVSDASASDAIKKSQSSNN